MTTEILERTKIEKPLKVIHESLFWPDDSPLHTLIGDKRAKRNNEGNYVIDLEADSFIWCFNGGRGAGKSTLMTLFAMWANYQYGFRIVANFEIEYILQRLHSREFIKAEPLDLYRLFCFEHDYDNCLILIDEAPDIISHMAAQTWKNRLVNVFVRQIRKNHNNLFLGAQFFELIDKSMRQQVDIRFDCEDASRKYGWGKRYRGMCHLARVIDQSGLWTGEPYEVTLMKMRDRGDYDVDPAEKIEVFPRFLWADTPENPGKPVFDSYKEFDIWDSLRRVDMKLQTYAVGDGQRKESPEYLKIARPILEQAMNEGAVMKKELYRAFNVNGGDKTSLSHRLSNAGARSFSHDKKLDFTDFSLEEFFKE